MRSIPGKGQVLLAGVLLCFYAGLAQGQVRAGDGQGHLYRPGPLPDGYRERTVVQWGFESQGKDVPAHVFFNLTGGNSPEKEPERYDIWPTVLIQSPEGGKVVDLKGGFHRYKWSHVAAAPGKGYFWGFLEYAVESPGDTIPVILSTDGGRTWKHVATLEKPDLDATVHGFEMNLNGRGRLQVASAKAPSPGTRTVFTYTTNDWGRTWRKEQTAEVSVLQAPDVVAPPSCEVAVQNLPEPLPKDCRLPERVLPK